MKKQKPSQKPSLVAYRVSTDDTPRGIVWASSKTSLGYLCKRLREVHPEASTAFINAKEITLNPISEVNYIYLPSYAIEAFGVSFPNGQKINA